MLVLERTTLDEEDMIHIYINIVKLFYFKNMLEDISHDKLTDNFLTCRILIGAFLSYKRNVKG